MYVEHINTRGTNEFDLNEFLRKTHSQNNSASTCICMYIPYIHTYIDSTAKKKKRAVKVYLILKLYVLRNLY